MKSWGLLPSAFAVPYAVLPLFPAFITLTAVTIPGISLVPRPFAVGLLGIMVLLAAYALAVLLIEPRRPAPTQRALLLWLGAIVVSAALGFNPSAGAVFIGIFALGLVWHFTLLRFYSYAGVSRAIYWSYTLSAGLASLAAIVMLVLRKPANQYAIGHARAIGTFILPGELAGYLIVFLPIAYVLARYAGDVRLRITAWCALIAGFAAFVLTFSRAGFMGLAAAIAFYLAAAGAVRRRYALLVIAAGFVAVALLFNVRHDPAENFTRLSIWQAGVEIVRRFPLTGVGPFDFARVYALVRSPDGEPQAFHAHSFLLTTFAETGILGLVAAVAAWWRFSIALRTRLLRASPARSAIALAVAAGLVGTWVQGLIDTVSVVIFGLWLPTMALALACADDGLAEAA